MGPWLKALLFSFIILVMLCLIMNGIIFIIEKITGRHINLFKL